MLQLAGPPPTPQRSRHRRSSARPAPPPPPPPPPAPRSTPHADATGRGIQLMRGLVDSVRFERRVKGGTVVHLRKELQFDNDAPGRRLAAPEPG